MHDRSSYERPRQTTATALATSERKSALWSWPLARPLPFEHKRMHECMRAHFKSSLTQCATDELRYDMHASRVPHATPATLVVILPWSLKVNGTFASWMFISRCDSYEESRNIKQDKNFWEDDAWIFVISFRKDLYLCWYRKLHRLFRAFILICTIYVIYVHILQLIIQL